MLSDRVCHIDAVSKQKNMLCFQNGASKAWPPGAATDLAAGGQGVEMVHQKDVVDYTGETTERKMSRL